MPNQFGSTKQFIVAQADLGGVIRFFETSFSHLLKLAPGELMGKRVSDITEPKFRPVSGVMFDNAVRTGIGYSIEKAFCDADGSEIPALVHVSVLRDGRMSPEAVVALIQPRCRWST